jgi:acetyltransferase EpsM
MLKKKIIILGAGGNANVIKSTIADVNQVSNQYEILGYLDDQVSPNNNSQIKGKITKTNVEKFKKYRDVFFLWSLSTIKLGDNILKKHKILNIEKKKFLTITHPTAVVSKYAKIGLGVTIHPFVNVGPDVIIMNNVHIFSQSLIGHNTFLDNFSYVASNSTIGASVKVNEGGYLGMNSTIRERVTIGKWSIVGMGSVVIKDTQNYSVVAGNPASYLKKRFN